MLINVEANDFSQIISATCNADRRQEILKEELSNMTVGLMEVMYQLSLRD